nr:phospholipase A-2-activating protein [Onthophagus taurus]
MTKPYKLSNVLLHHSLDVRCVSATEDGCILSGSRDKTAKLWKPDGLTTDYFEAMTYRDQKNFVGSILYIEPTEDFPDGLVITGGNDNAILIYKPSEPFATSTIKEHTNTVCCLTKGLEPKTFLSSSWDNSAKLWNLNNVQSSLVTFTGHSASVWSVIQLSNSNVVTASADKTIGLWFKNGQRFMSLTGHADCVRDLADFAENQYFISVSNDATIKLWSYGGENINTLYGHTNYIYSVARNLACGEECFVTSDEDKTIRFWENGINTQSIQLPSQSVWSVCCLKNGDIVTGSSDGAIRIFTQDESRFASEDALKAYDEEVMALQKQTSQEIGGYKVSDLPGKEALYDPGKKAGQMKMIREPQGVVAYTWVEDGDNSHWEKVGDVLGGTDKSQEGKTMFEGKAYDFVFSVDVEDGKPPLKLPYNKGDDPYTAAHMFLSKYNLPAIYLDQVVDFILKNSTTDQPTANADYVDPFTGGSRYTPASASGGFGQSGSNVDPFTGASSYSTGTGTATSSTKKPSTATYGANTDPFTGSASYTSVTNQLSKFFPLMDYRTFDMGDPQVILKKLKEFNQKVGDSNNQMEEADLEDVVKLCKQHRSDLKCYDNLFRLLNWPEDIVFPVIDIIRLAMKLEENNKIISERNDGEIIEKLKPFIGNDCKVQNNVVVSLRTLSNFFCYKSGEELMFKNRVEIIEDIVGLCSSNKNIEVGIATLLLNSTILSHKKQDEIGLYLLANILPEMVASVNDPEAQFRILVALGTLISYGPLAHRQQVKSNVLENEKFKEKIKILSQTGLTDVEVKRKNCALQVQNELSF